MDNKFCERLKDTLHDNNISQSTLSARTGISQGSISEYIKGVRQPTAEKIYHIAKALGVTADFLLGLTDY